MGRILLGLVSLVLMTGSSPALAGESWRNLISKCNFALSSDGSPMMEAFVAKVPVGKSKKEVAICLATMNCELSQTGAKGKPITLNNIQVGCLAPMGSCPRDPSEKAATLCAKSDDFTAVEETVSTAVPAGKGGSDASGAAH